MTVRLPPRAGAEQTAAAGAVKRVKEGVGKVVFYYSSGVILESCNGTWALSGWVYGVGLYILVLFF